VKHTRARIGWRSTALGGGTRSIRAFRRWYHLACHVGYRRSQSIAFLVGKAQCSGRSTMFAVLAQGTFFAIGMARGNCKVQHSGAPGPPGEWVDARALGRFGVRRSASAGGSIFSLEMISPAKPAAGSDFVSTLSAEYPGDKSLRVRASAHAAQSAQPRSCRNENCFSFSFRPTKAAHTTGYARKATCPGPSGRPRHRPYAR